MSSADVSWAATGVMHTWESNSSGNKRTVAQLETLDLILEVVEFSLFVGFFFLPFTAFYLVTASWLL